MFHSTPGTCVEKDGSFFKVNVFLILLTASLFCCVFSGHELIAEGEFLPGFTSGGAVPCACAGFLKTHVSEFVLAFLAWKSNHEKSLLLSNGRLKYDLNLLSSLVKWKNAFEGEGKDQMIPIAENLQGLSRLWQVLHWRIARVAGRD
ncbi:hypothetical protein BJ741DRAFT_713638 [Chytriomyces cf. hyalinus JEL632]|nr:hypothetical protein BJ741DRAFT_713638 [Chytriomyces cf. hyalinus JEL632]